MERWAWGDLRARPLFWAAAFLFGGCCLGFPGAWRAGLGLAALLFIWAYGRPNRPGAYLAVLLALTGVGAMVGSGAADVDVPASLHLGGEATLEGEVERIHRFDDTLQVTIATTVANDEPVRFRAALYPSSGDVNRLRVGQRLLVEARLKPIEPVHNWGEYDAHEPRRRRGLIFSGSFDADRAVVLTDEASWRRHVDAKKAALAQLTHAWAPTPDASALYLALAAGMRETLAPDLEVAFARSGLAHVLSVSGLHVAVLALALLWALRRALALVSPLARRFDVRRIAAPVCIPVIFAYVLFTGSQPPAIRSALMASCSLVGLSLWRRSDALTAVAFAAWLLCLLEPASSADLSLRLSFMSVLGMILLVPALRNTIPVARPDPAARGARGLVGHAREIVIAAFCASLAVTVATAPLLADAFHQISIAGVAANILALPISGLLTLLAAFGAAVASIFPVAATPLVAGGVYTAEAMVRLAKSLGDPSWATLTLPTFGPLLCGIYWGALAAFALGPLAVRRVGFCVAAAVAAWVVLGPWMTAPELEVTFLAVGHGDAVVISSKGQHALIDGGGVPNGVDTGKRYVLPYLREKGIDELDLAVLSHPHPDHALGMVSALSEVPTRRLWLASGTADGDLSFQVASAAQGALVEEVQVGTPARRLGAATLEVLGPPADRALLEGVNDRSVVLRLRHEDVVFLLTGDIEAPAEEHLDPGPVTVLKAPHHGSRTSSTPAFVRRTAPRYVVFCVGRRNRFGFPHDEVVERYRAAGSECFRTDAHGSIRFVSNGRDVRVQTFHDSPLPTEQPGLTVVER